MKKTLVLGATPDSTRFAYRAANMLVQYGHEIVPVGIKKGQVAGQTIRNDYPVEQDIDTVTLYVGANNLPPLFEYILKLQPKRILFNPGTENADLIRLAQEHNIEVVLGCTLVMLSSDTY
jgi:predicted CoA-binding protein